LVLFNEIPQDGISCKCKFKQQKIEYLGLIISEGQIEMDPVKVAGIAEWLVPTSRQEKQSVRICSFPINSLIILFPFASK
jgi:hypothetical protein